MACARGRRRATTRAAPSTCRANTSTGRRAASGGYRFNNGRNWRAERWDDGALVAKTIDPSVARLSPERAGSARARRRRTSSSWRRTIRARPRGARAGRRDLRRALRQTDGRASPATTTPTGCASGVWRFWNEDGKLAREVEYLAGVREHAAREWHPNGAPAVEGFYVAGEREGRWRWWDASGRSSARRRIGRESRVRRRAATRPVEPDGDMLRRR